MNPAHDDIVDMVLGADLLRFIIELTKAAFDIKKEVRTTGSPCI